MVRKPAHNGRFGAMSAVIPQTILCEIERYYPAASSVEAATAPSRWDVSGKAGGAARAETEAGNLKLNKNINNPNGYKN